MGNGSKNESMTSAAIPDTSWSTQSAWKRAWIERLNQSSILKAMRDMNLTAVPQVDDCFEKRAAFFYDLQDRVDKLPEADLSNEVSALRKLVSEVVDDFLCNPEFEFAEAALPLLQMESGVRAAIRVSLARDEGLKGLDEGFMTPGMANAFSKMVTRHSCQCGVVIPKYPGRYPSKCPNCGEPLNIVKDKLLRKGNATFIPEELEPHIENIRREVWKRRPLLDNLKAISRDDLDRHDALKASISCLTRIVIEDQKHHGKGILEVVGYPLILDIASLALNEGAVQAALRVKDFFVGEE